MWAVVVGLAVFKTLQPTTSSAVPGPLDARGFRFRFVDASSGEPVRYDACSPIHYVINPELAPAGGIRDVHTAMEKTSEGTGIEFVYDGETNETPSEARPEYQPERYGERWAPVLVAWAPDLPSTLRSDMQAVGRAGSTFRTNGDGQSVYVTGMAIFNAGADLRSGFAGETWGQVIVHEMGHLVGLDHVDYNDSVMNPVMGLRPAGWGPGDRRGLWELGLGRDCLKAPNLP